MSLFGSDDGEEPDVEEEPAEPEAEGGEPETSLLGKVGAGIRTYAGKAAWAVGINTVQFVSLLTRGPTKKVWKNLSLVFLHRYHKLMGGDRIGLDFRPNGKAEFVPVKWLPPEAVDEEQKPGWKAKDRDKTWTPTTMGRNGSRLGKTPVVPLDSDTWRATSILEARIAEAVDQGQHRPLYRVDEAEMTATIDMQDPTAAGGAVADGGAVVTNREFNPRTSPIFEDIIIDLNAGEGYDGSAISFWKSQELMAETTATEEMTNQEHRGFLAGRSGKDITKLAVKLMIIAGIIAGLGLIGPELVTALFAGGGGGGGGGGGMIPITMGI